MNAWTLALGTEAGVKNDFEIFDFDAIDRAVALESTRLRATTGHAAQTGVESGGDAAASDAPPQEPEVTDAEGGAVARGLAFPKLESGERRRAVSAGMLREVEQAWLRPQLIADERPEDAAPADETLRRRIAEIHIPKVALSDVPLSRAIETLSLLSEEYDPQREGVNIVLVDPKGTDPLVTITLRRLSLERMLEFVAQSVGFEIDIGREAVFVQQGSGQGRRLETGFFSLNRSTMIRLTGLPDAGEGAGATVAHDPFGGVAEAGGGGSGGGGGGPESREAALRSFLQRAGIPFDSIEGSNIALADGQLIVTQTPRNLEKVRNILRRYSEVKQVEIEARFIEVQVGELEELGFNWYVRNDGSAVVDPVSGNPIRDVNGRPLMQYNQQFSTANRNLSEPFTVGGDTRQLRISRPPATDAEGRVISTGEISVPQGAVSIPNMVDLATGVMSPLAHLSGVIGGADVDLVIRALQRSTGNELLSAPKLTVLSGKSAEIVVAQELRYPERYGDTDAQVGRGEGEGSSAGVAITAGTPQDFTVRNIGVEMRVTPTVEDNNAISLVLEPKVTEFEGFVEYGGTSVAIASNTTVTVPSGFFQPIFSVRRVRTEVTIWDGSTVVMGGLTREHAVSVEDRVPLLGSLPLVGRLFRSEGESSQKRNLLIFVTANLISPGGAPVDGRFSGVGSGDIYRNPYHVGPGGALPAEATAKGSDVSDTAPAEVSDVGAGWSVRRGRKH